MSSLYEWRRLREIEREIEQSDPDLAARFQFPTPTPWHERIETRLSLVVLAAMLVVLGSIAGNSLLIGIGIAVGLIAGSLWLADWVRRHEDAPPPN